MGKTETQALLIYSGRGSYWALPIGGDAAFQLTNAALAVESAACRQDAFPGRVQTCTAPCSNSAILCMHMYLPVSITEKFLLLPRPYCFWSKQGILVIIKKKPKTKQAARLLSQASEALPCRDTGRQLLCTVVAFRVVCTSSPSTALSVLVVGGWLSPDLRLCSPREQLPALESPPWSHFSYCWH